MAAAVSEGLQLVLLFNWLLRLTQDCYCGWSYLGHSLLCWGSGPTFLEVVPLHLPPGDTSTERNVFINGTQDQIDSAKELVNEVISGVKSSCSKDYEAALQHLRGLPWTDGTGRIWIFTSGTIGSSAMGLIQLHPAVLAVFLMDKFGRRPLLLFSAAGMGTGTLSLALSFLLKEQGLLADFGPYLALFGILLFVATYPVGMGGVPFVIMSEIFPINIKGAAGSLAMVVSFTSSRMVSYAFNFMMDWSSYGYIEPLLATLHEQELAWAKGGSRGNTTLARHLQAFSLYHLHNYGASSHYMLYSKS